MENLIIGHVHFLKEKGEIYRTTSHIQDELLWNDIYVTPSMIEKCLLKNGFQKTNDNISWILR